MNLRLTTVTLFCGLICTAVLAQSPARYVPPRTEHGQPDLQGAWATAFLTTLERMPGADALAATPDQARQLAADFLAKPSKLADPDVAIFALDQLTKVKGEYRTSVIVDPPDGKMPLTPAGADTIAKVRARTKEKFDNPEERTLGERCLENFTYAPIRAIPVLLTRQIVQTRDYIVISAEDVPGPRIIHLRGDALPDLQRTIGGYSVGHWEGDSLVVNTSHLSAEDPVRGGAAGPMAIGPGTTIIERFTRVSPTELLYQYTVKDDELYVGPWSGEFSMTRFNGQVLEYACHEANYSMTNMLRGGRVQDKEAGTR